MTERQQAAFISAACREAGLDGHIEWIEGRKQAHTWAERIAVRFKGNGRLPVKNSYMYCDTLDMCFFYSESGMPSMSYAGYVTSASTDITEGKLVKAFQTADTVLRIMKRLAEEALENS